MLRTAHGDVPTPAFMPVGTKGTVKARDPDELRAVGTTILLGNTYHLHFRPGRGADRRARRPASFMAWDGPILTDSGGYQVFSLRDTLSRVDDDGVTFRSVTTAHLTLTPEIAAAIQAQLGSDVAMCLDIVSARRRAASRARGGRASHNAVGGGSATLERAPGQLRFAIAQGSTRRGAAQR